MAVIVFMPHYGLLLVYHVCQTRFSTLWGFSPVEKVFLASIPPKPSAKLQSMATQAHSGTAPLPPDPVITAHTRHQHYYTSNHSVIIPRSTSKTQLAFQGKNKKSWIMYEEGLIRPFGTSGAQFMLSEATAIFDNQDICKCDLI